MDSQIVTNLTQRFPEATPIILEHVAQCDPWDVFHLNPFELAATTGLDVDLVIDWLLYSVYEGGFDLIWNTLCPFCGANEHQHGSLNQLETDFHCFICNKALTGELDDRVEVAFQPRNVIRDLQFNRFIDQESYHRAFFSDNFQPPKQMVDLLSSLSKGFWIVQPGQSQRVTFETEEKRHRLISVDRHSQVFFELEPDGATEAEIQINHQGFVGEEVKVGVRKVELVVSNLSDQPVGFMLQKLAFEGMAEMMKNNRPTFKRFLSGKEVLNRQVFRDLFPIQDLPADLNLRVGEVTLLFTDLKGSTAMYEAEGDIDAFRMVKDHFVLLTQAVRENRGAVVKTIGDAVMASFSQPTDALQAALQMLRSIADYNQTSPREVGLKIGLHKGPALAVNANQSLDYFGRTVNIAARVQGQADAGEIWLSEPMTETPGITSLLKEANYQTEAQVAILRGIKGDFSLLKAVAP